MKRSKFSEEQVAYALRQAESGTVVGDVCRQVGISEATFYAWKKKYAHLGVNEVRRLRQLEEENTRLKRLVADLSLDKHMLSEALRKRGLKPATSPRSWPGGSTTRIRSVVCGLADWRSSVARPGIERVEPRIKRRCACASANSRTRVCASGSYVSGSCFAARAGLSTRSAGGDCIGSRACSCECVCDAGNIKPCIAARRRLRRGRENAGAWILCTMPWPMAGLFAS